MIITYKELIGLIRETYSRLTGQKIKEVYEKDPESGAIIFPLRKKGRVVPRDQDADIIDIDAFGEELEQPEDEVMSGGVPVKSLTNDDVGTMIDGQLSQLVYRNGDNAYRDNFLITLNRVLRLNTVAAYLKHVESVLLEEQPYSKVAKHPSMIREEMDELSDYLDMFLVTLKERPDRVFDQEVNFAALQVVDYLEEIDYDLMS